MGSFWEYSWEQADPERIAKYTEAFDTRPDRLTGILRRCGVQTVCDAGCGCGAYAAKLAANGFSVSGFDVSARAVEIAQALLERESLRAELKTAGIISTGYAESAFDGVIARDVLDHLRRADAAAAIKELCRITKPGDIVLFTVDSLDEEYQTEPHTVNADGDYVYIGGKWKGMVFHPYDAETVRKILPAGMMWEILENRGELAVLLRKNAE